MPNLKLTCKELTTDQRESLAVLEKPWRN